MSVTDPAPPSASPRQTKVTIEAPETPPRTLFHHAARHKSAPVLSDYLRQHGVPINTRCGGRGLCESCSCQLVAGAVTHKSTGQSITADHAPVHVKTCEVTLPNTGDTHIRVPARAYLRYEPQIVTDYRTNIPCGHDPLYQLQPHEKIDARKSPPLGVAIDIGTTTVALLLVDLASGKVLAQSAMFNQQMNLGDDVVTRIDLCARDKAMVKKMQHAVADETILPLLDSALAYARMTRAQVRVFSIAGNTTMLHLVAGIDPTPLGTAPFTPAFLSHYVIGADKVFTDHLPAPAPVHLLPSAAAYVGSDLTAGVVASGMLYDQGPSLLVDVGTNGEMILKTAHEKFFGCATAAGPAFEGAGLSCGMRAGDGVIAYIALEGRRENFRVTTETIGRQNDDAQARNRTVGICGSAYIDFLAEARRCGLVSSAGRFDTEFDTRGHILPGNHGDRAFRLAYAPGKQPIAITERDIASLLQAKAATAAGVLTLLSRTNLQPADIKTVYLAGGFGTKMKAANAIACGLLPGFTPAQIQPVGNTSLAGAYLALLDRSLLKEMQRVGESMEVIELNLDPAFEDCYIEQLELPVPA